jgi:hypothetical protein
MAPADRAVQRLPGLILYPGHSVTDRDKNETERGRDETDRGENETGRVLKDRDQG